MAEQQNKIGLLFQQIEAAFAEFDRLQNAQLAESKLAEITGMIREVKGIIKEYEREARLDGVSADEILAVKTRYVSQVNAFVSRKKAAATSMKAMNYIGSDSGTPTGQAARAQPDYGADYVPGPPGAAAQPGHQRQLQEMDNQEIIAQGRQGMDDIDAELERGKRIVNETEETAVQTAAALKNQTDQMGRIVNELAEIDFSMKRAGKVIGQIARGLATDKCIMMMLCLVVSAIVVLIIMEIAGVGDGVVKLPGPGDEVNGGNRKLLSRCSLGCSNAVALR